MNETGLPVEVDNPHIADSYLCYRLMEVDHPRITPFAFGTCQDYQQSMNETGLPVEVVHPHVEYSHLCYRLMEVDHPLILQFALGTCQG